MKGAFVVTKEEKYLKALHDLEEAQKSFDALTENQKKQLIEFKFGVEMAKKIFILKQQFNR